jgi:hypothetical protein
LVIEKAAVSLDGMQGSLTLYHAEQCRHGTAYGPGHVVRVLQRIRAGNGLRAVAVGYGAVWAAAEGDAGQHPQAPATVVVRDPLDRGDQRGADAAAPLYGMQREDFAAIRCEHVCQHARELPALFDEQGRVVERAIQSPQASDHV